MQAANELRAVFEGLGVRVLVTDGSAVQEIQDCNLFVAFGSRDYAKKIEGSWNTREHVRLAIQYRKPMFLINMRRPLEYFEDAYAVALFADPKRTIADWRPSKRSYPGAPDPTFDALVSLCLDFYHKDGTQCPNFVDKGCKDVGCQHSHMNIDGRDLREPCVRCSKAYHRDMKEDGTLHELCIDCRGPCKRCKQKHADVTDDGHLHECWVKFYSTGPGGGSAGGGGAGRW